MSQTFSTQDLSPSGSVSVYQSVEHWPVAVRSAELANGTLVGCGPGVRLAAWPDSTEVRLAALRQVIGPNCIPVLLTAAWVWQCARSPGYPVSCSTISGGRPKHTPQLDVHEFRFQRSDIELVGDTPVPTRLRTACDLLRLANEFTPRIVVACRLLLQQERENLAEATLTLQRGPSRHRARGLTRLTEILGHPTVNRRANS